MKRRFQDGGVAASPAGPQVDDLARSYAMDPKGPTTDVAANLAHALGAHVIHSMSSEDKVRLVDQIMAQEAAMKGESETEQFYRPKSQDTFLNGLSTSGLERGAYGREADTSQQRLQDSAAKAIALRRQLGDQVSPITRRTGGSIQEGKTPMRMRGGVRRFQDGGVNPRSIPNPGMAAVMAQMNPAAFDRNAPQLTSANSGWVSPSAPPGFQNPTVAPGPPPTPQQQSGLQGLGISPGSAGQIGGVQFPPGGPAGGGAPGLNPQAIQQAMQQRRMQGGMPPQMQGWPPPGMPPGAGGPPPGMPPGAGGPPPGAGMPPGGMPQRPMQPQGPPPGMQAGAGPINPNSPMAGPAAAMQAKIAAGGPAMQSLSGPAATQAAIAKSGMSPDDFNQWIQAQGGGPLPGMAQMTGPGYGPSGGAGNQAAMAALAQKYGHPLPAQGGGQMSAALGGTGMAKGGTVGDGDADDAPKKRGRKFGAKEEAAEDIPEKKAKGGKVKHRKPPKAPKLAIPMTPGDDAADQIPAGPPPGIAAAGPAAGPPPPAGPPPGMKKGGKLKKKAKAAHAHKKPVRKAKGGECEKMAAGGAMKVRRGFPNVSAAPKKKAYAQGGKVRGGGAATKGTRFQGIF